MTPSRALDVAAGAGRNALFLAKNGWSVQAVDGSPAALEILRHRATKLALTLETHLVDLEHAPLPFADASFDLICVVLYLQRDLFPQLQRLVRPGGLIATQVLLSDAAHAGDPRWRLAPGDLPRFFDGWEIIHRETRKHRDGRTSEELIARRS